MANRTLSSPGFTPGAFADAATMTANQMLGLLGGSTTQRVKVKEVKVIGLAGSSAPTPMVLARDSTIAATAIGLGTIARDASDDPATAALAAPVQAFATATTMPQRSATLHLRQLGINAFGGIIKWIANLGEEINMVGNAVNVGEISLSSYTGGTPGLVQTDIVYEAL